MHAEKSRDHGGQIRASTGAGCGLQLTPLGDLVQAIATLHLHGGHAEGRHAREPTGQGVGELGQARLADGPHAGHDAAAGGADLLVVGARHAHRIFVAPRADPGRVGVGIDESRCHQPLTVIDDPRLGVPVGEVLGLADGRNPPRLDDQRQVIGSAQRVVFGGPFGIAGHQSAATDVKRFVVAHRSLSAPIEAAASSARSSLP